MKGKGIYNNMLANSMPLHIPLTPGMWSKVFFFQKVAFHINGNEAENTMKANIGPFYLLTTPGWEQRVQIFFFLKNVVLHIKLKVKQYITLC